MQSILPGQPSSQGETHGLRSVHDRARLFEYLAELTRRRDFIWFSAIQQLRSENVRAAFGNFWLLLTPLMNILVYWLVFGKLLNLNRGAGNYVTFLTIGTLTFDLLARSLPAASRLLDANITLIRSVHFPRVLLPVSFAVEQLFKFFPSIVVMVGFVLIGGDSVSLSWLLLVPAVFIGFVFMLGLNLIFARIGKLAADIGLALPHLTRLLFYGSGVLYLPDSFTQNSLILRAFDANPFFEIISLARSALMEDHSASAGLWIAASGWAIGTLMIGIVFFWHGESTYGE